MKKKLKKIFLKPFLFFKTSGQVLSISWNELGRLKIIIALKCMFRYIWFGIILRRTKSFDKNISGEKVGSHTIDHNFKALSLYAVNSYSGFRPEKLIQPLAIFDKNFKKNAKVLFIGPRAESELFLAKSYGFSWKNLVGLDLISYSPKVELGDMHDMSFGDNTFDIVIMGWVITYSQTPKIAMSEVVRVLKPGGYCSVGAEHNPMSIEEIKSKKGYIPGADFKTKSCEEIKALYGDNMHRVIYEHDITTYNPEVKGDLVSVVQIKK
ncbi:class I SAM-dependent methyltransferase [Flavobacteriales bacterium]|nr:class I SAM-dependent methyltransferase [Flavobacteriales bacterium]